METIYFKNTKEIKKAKEEIEKNLNVTITLVGKKALIEGASLNEYEAWNILDAISFGFSAKKALQLKESELSFKKINIKDFTRRKNMYDVRARIIGKEGKVKRTIEDLSDCEMIIKDNMIGIIGYAESIDIVITALTNLIRGSKVSNVYNFLEKMNRDRRTLS